jgi:hypothetical protein
MYISCRTLAQPREIQKEPLKEPWLGQSTLYRCRQYKNYSTMPPRTKPPLYRSPLLLEGIVEYCRVMWACPNVGDGTCIVLTLLARELAELSNVDLLMRSVDHRQMVKVVAGWLDMYRDHGEYISTRVRVVWNKGK